MIFGAGLALWGLLFICIAIAAIIFALFGVFYALKLFRKNKIKSVSVLMLSLLIIVPICIFLAKLILPKKQLDINLDFESVTFDNSSEIKRLCKKPSDQEDEYSCSSEYSYNLKIYLPNGAEYRVKCIHLRFSINPNNSKLESVSFFNKSTYSLNELNEYFKNTSLEENEYFNESPVPEKISTGMLAWLASDSDSANTECEYKPEYSICIRGSSLGGDYSLGYNVWREE